MGWSLFLGDGMGWEMVGNSVLGDFFDFFSYSG